MDKTIDYADILTQVVREQCRTHYPLQPGLKNISSCDRETGQFLLILIGWDKKHWHHSILFHAQLVDGRIIIETDMTEGLKPLLLEAGIRQEDFLSDRERDWMEGVSLAA